MNKLLPIVLGTALASFSGASLSATVVLDFAALATGNEGTWDSRSGTGAAGGLFSDLLDTWTIGGISVTADGFNSNNVGTTEAYLDGPSANRPGGLGACSTVNATTFQCNNASDDNAGIAGDNTPTGGGREGFTLTFDTSVSLAGLSFNNRDHFPLTTGSILINASLFDIATGDLGTLGSSNVWSFQRATAANGGVDFYLDTATVSPVPLPAAVWLFGSALLGVFGIARKSSANRSTV